MLAVKTKSMTMPQIRKKAKALGITTGKIKKIELIHTIQMTEGCTPCFATSNGQCTNEACCFIHDCLKASA